MMYDLFHLKKNTPSFKKEKCGGMVFVSQQVVFVNLNSGAIL